MSDQGMLKEEGKVLAREETIMDCFIETFRRNLSGFESLNSRLDGISQRAGVYKEIPCPDLSDGKPLDGCIDTLRLLFMSFEEKLEYYHQRLIEIEKFI